MSKINMFNSVIIKVIKKYIPDVVAIYQFGSTGTIYENAESDLDIAILPCKKISPEVRFNIANDLMSATHKEFVDVIDLFSAPPFLKIEIISKGKLIYNTEKLKTENFEDVAFSQYLLFNQERKDLVTDVIKRGSIY